MSALALNSVVSSCQSEFGLAGKTQGAQQMSGGTCTALAAETSTDVYETTAACSNSETHCGTLEKSDARFRGCFPTDPQADTYYYDAACTEAWTSATSSTTDDGNTVDTRSCQQGQIGMGGQEMYLNFGTCSLISTVPEMDDMEPVTAECGLSNNSNPQYQCETAISTDGEIKSQGCIEQYSPSAGFICFDSACSNCITTTVCFGDNCNFPFSGGLGFLILYCCYQFAPVICCCSIIGIVAQCMCCKGSGHKKSSSGEKKKKKKSSD